MTARQPFSSVWAREPRQARSPGLSREQIVRATVDLLDADGLDAFSMRKLGARLGSGATSVYWYVANKDELLELAYDEVFAEMVTFAPGTTTWRNTASAFAHSMRQMFLGHPWATSLYGRLPGIGPRCLQVADRLRRAFLDAGFDAADADYCCSALTSYVYGVTVPEITWTSTMTANGMDLDEWREQAMPTIEKAIGQDFPEMMAEYRERTNDDQRLMLIRNFDFGLACLLDGIEARLGS